MTTPTQNTETLMNYIRGADTALQNGWYHIAKEFLTDIIYITNGLNREVEYFIYDHPYDIDMEA